MGTTQGRLWRKTFAMTDDQNNEIGSRVRAARRARGLTQVQLADLTGITQQTLAKIEQGKIRVSRQLPKLLKELDIPLRVFDEETGTMIVAGEMSHGAGGNRANDASPSRDRPEGNWVLALQMRPEGQFLEDWSNIGSLDQIQQNAMGPKVLALYVAEQNMRPAIEPGDVVALHARLPALPGTDCAFINQNVGDGSWQVEFRRLVSISDAAWTVEQFNPPRTYELSRDRFHARRVVAIYRRT